MDDTATFPILTKLGGPAAVHRALVERDGKWKTRKAIEMWITRGRIPGDAQLALMRLADDQGIAYSVDDFEPTEPRAPAA